MKIYFAQKSNISFKISKRLIAGNMGKASKILLFVSRVSVFFKFWLLSSLQIVFGYSKTPASLEMIAYNISQANQMKSPRGNLR